MSEDGGGHEATSLSESITKYVDNHRYESMTDVGACLQHVVVLNVTVSKGLKW